MMFLIGVIRGVDITSHKACSWIAKFIDPKSPGISANIKPLQKPIGTPGLSAEQRDQQMIKGKDLQLKAITKRWTGARAI
jgi:hypothetical protein